MTEHHVVVPFKADDLFPNNTTCDFRVNLARSLVLDGEHMVALEELLLPKGTVKHCCNEMYICADLVEHHIVGDCLMPLLRMCSTALKRDQPTSEIYIRPYYVRVSKRFIDQIRVRIITANGELCRIPNESPLVLKLHFKQA